jgi:hypothetical protein
MYYRTEQYDRVSRRQEPTEGKAPGHVMTRCPVDVQIDFLSISGGVGNEKNTCGPFGHNLHFCRVFSGFAVLCVNPA